jgi:F-type H+-transporting ATPase subunit b
MSGMLRSLLIVIVGLVIAGGATEVLAAGDGGHGAHGAADGDHAAPQSKEVPGMIPKRDLALWSLVTFVLMMIVLCLFVWPPLMKGLNERERHIRQDIADAEANRLKSEALIAEREAKLATVHEEIRELLTEARRDSERMKTDIIATAQKEADATKHRAIAEIERSRDQALSELFDFVSNNVVGATERVIGRSLSSGDHDRLVSEALSEMNVRRN